MCAVQLISFSTVCVVFGVILASGVDPAPAAPLQGEPESTVTPAKVATPPGDDASKDELGRLQGTWVCISREIGEQVLPVPEDDQLVTNMENISIVRGDSWMESGEGGKEPERFLRIKLDSSTEPKQMDLISDTPDQEFTGIYQLEEDTFTLCITIDPDSPIRPTRFVTQKGLPVVLLKFRKLK